MNQLQAEVSIHQRKNEKLTNVISDQSQELKQIKRQALPNKGKVNNIMVIAEESYRGSRNVKVEADNESEDEVSDGGNTDQDE